MRKYNKNIFKKYDRKTDTIITKFLILPVGRIISLLFLNFTQFKPYQITLLGLLISIISAYFFTIENYVIAALIFQLALIFDCVDGYVARIKNIGSAFGIILDGYVDFIKILINSIAIIFSLNFDYKITILFALFIILNLFESYLDVSINKCFNLMRKKKKLTLNFIDKKIINIKNKLSRKGLRTIFYYTQERYFMVFFVGAILDNFLIVLILNLILVIIFLHIKIILDLSLIKNQIINKTKEELKFRDFV